MPVAFGTTGAPALGFLLTLGGIPLDIGGIILAGGAGMYASKELGRANKQL